jgi:hypothetical protein
MDNIDMDSFKPSTEKITLVKADDVDDDTDNW